MESLKSSEQAQQIKSADMEELRRLIASLLKFNTSQYTDSFILRRVNIRLRVKNISSISEYNLLLAKDIAERDLLKKELTIHVTHFFRDFSAYSAFAKDAIPIIFEAKKNSSKKTIKILSAGGSTGEEAYSIAICFAEAMRESNFKFNVNIISCDRDDATIEKAKISVYEESQFKETPPEYVARYFSKFNDEKTYYPIDLIRKMVQFVKCDLLLYDIESGYDAIFCRNTVIYFNRHAKEILYSHFYDCLNEPGFLILGKTELLAGRAKEQFSIFNSVERIYKKENIQAAANNNL
ncbi:MAG: protein-glutamate O-methyltransferase CheR [archaeon]